MDVHNNLREVLHCKLIQEYAHQSLRGHRGFSRKGIGVDTYRSIHRCPSCRGSTERVTSEVTDTLPPSKSHDDRIETETGTTCTGRVHTHLELRPRRNLVRTGNVHLHRRWRWRIKAVRRTPSGKVPHRPSRRQKGPIRGDYSHRVGSRGSVRDGPGRQCWNEEFRSSVPGSEGFSSVFRTPFGFRSRKDGDPTGQVFEGNDPPLTLSVGQNLLPRTTRQSHV